tara:strand:- start:189 stop:383 length:195 start_codon:yes stop_codon:yes gene_type:complete
MDTSTFTSYLGPPDELRESPSQWAYKITRDVVNAIASALMVYGVLRAAYALESINNNIHPQITS